MSSTLLCLTIHSMASPPAENIIGADGAHTHCIHCQQLPPVWVWDLQAVRHAGSCMRGVNTAIIFYHHHARNSTHTTIMHAQSHSLKCLGSLTKKGGRAQCLLAELDALGVCVCVGRGAKLKVAFALWWWSPHILQVCTYLHLAPKMQSPLNRLCF